MKNEKYNRQIDMSVRIHTQSCRDLSSKKTFWHKGPIQMLMIH